MADVEWQFTLCGPEHWRLVPRVSLVRDRWPRVFQFHWLFIYIHRIESAS